MVEMGTQEAELRWGTHGAEYYLEQAKSKSLWDI